MKWEGSMCSKQQGCADFFENGLVLALKPYVLAKTPLQLALKNCVQRHVK
jgi:hypothetical protein